ncbi:MAG: caspase family protein [Chitinophagaceae bacterium]
MISIRNLTLFFALLLISRNTGAQSPRLMLPVGHTDKITVFQFSPDGRLIATGADDHTVKLWDVNTGKLLADLKGHTNDIEVLSFDPTGNRLLSTASIDTFARLWDTRTGTLIKAIHTGRSFIDFAIFSPDGTKIAVTSSSGVPSLYSAFTGLPIVTLKIGYTSIQSVAFSPDSRKLILQTYNNPLICDTETGSVLATLKGHNSYIECVAFSGDGMKVATGSGDKTIKIWQAANGELIHTLSGHTATPKSITISPDGKRMVSSIIGDRMPKLWDLEKGAWIADLVVSSYSSIASISFSSDSRSIITMAIGGAHLWDATTGALKNPRGPEWKVAGFSHAGNDYLVSYNDTTRLIDANNGTTKAVLRDVKNPGIVAFSPDDQKIAGHFGKSKNGAIWDSRTGKLLVKLQGYTNPVERAYLSADSAYIITEAYQSAGIWNIQDNNLSPVDGPVNDPMEELKYSPDGTRLLRVSKTDDQVISLWDARRMQCLDPNLQKRGMQDISLEDDNNFTFSSDSKKLFLSDIYLESYVVDGKTGALQQTIDHDRLWLSTVNNDLTRFLGYTNEKLELWDFTSGQKIQEWEVKDHVRELVFIGKGSRFLILGADNFPVYEQKAKKPLLTIPGGLDALNHDKTKLLVWHYDMQKGIQAWDLEKLKQLWARKTNKDVTEAAYWDVIWSKDGSQVYYSTNSGNIGVMDPLTGTLIREFKGYAQRLQTSADGKYIFGIYEAEVSVYDAHTFTPISTLTGHQNKVTTVLVLPDPGKVLTVSEDNTAKMWDLETGHLLYTCLMMNRETSFKMIPSGYYMANLNASKLLYYVNKDMRVISFEQLDVKYNRPDKVLEAIGSTDTALMKSYRKAWEKRIKKLGVDTTAFRDGYSVPEADFANRDAIEYEQKSGNLSLRIKATDSDYKLDRFNIWVNEAPVFGQRGISIRKRNKNDLDTTITIKLSQGENRIETSITNVNGTESYRMPLQVNYTPAIKQKESTRFIGIGIDKFADNQYNLQYSTKDIRDLSVKLKEKYGNDIVIDTLFNEQVTVKNVKALKQKLLQTSENDKVIIAYSGHGMLSKDFDYYLSTYSVNFEKPEQNGLPYDELESLLDSIPARKKLMLIDACHSGEVDKEDLVTLNASSDSLIKGLKPVAYKKEGHLGLKNSFELMQSLFVNVGKSTGATIISAAAGTQFALERNDLKNGVFTYCILEAMKTNASMRISELKTIVGKRVEELTKGLQKPTSRNETIAVNWNVW